VVSASAGTLQAREVRKQCVGDGCRHIVGSEALARLVKPYQRYCYDLIVHVGLARYLAGKQREEIRAELHQSLGIDLSAATVSHLCDRFLVALECLHLLRAPYLRAAMPGGYPLHLDATSDRGKGGLFVCLDGFRGWVLMATRIDSERDEYLRPLIDQTVGLFGDPVAIVRDLSEAGAGAVAHLRERGIADLVCHYHFAAAVGKNLFDKRYLSLRGLLRCSRVRPELRTLLQQLRRYRASESTAGRFGPGRVREQLLALVLWLLEGDGKKDPCYPFALADLDFVRRCRRALTKADRWVPCPRSRPERRALRHLQGLVARLERDQRLAQTQLELDRAWQAFCKLRDVLRLNYGELPASNARQRTATLPVLELRRLQQIEDAVAEYRKQLERRVAGLSRIEAKSCPDAIVLRYLKRYGPHLFGHPVLRDEDDSVLAVVERTNNMLETFFGRSKQRLRRRLGRAHLGRDLEQQPPQVMLATNLEHPDYVRVLCGSLDSLPEAFAGLDAAAQASVSLARNNRDWALLRQVRKLLEADSAADHPAAAAGPSSPLNGASATVS